jgi:hypothetical protein
MATKKSTTKAKTNTAKKTTRATKTTPKNSRTLVAKTSAKKTTSAAAKAKTVGTRKASVVTVKKPGIRTPYERLRGLHLISAGLFALLAVAAGYFIKDTTFGLWLNHLTNDDLASRTTTVFAPAVRGVYDLNLRWATVGLLAISAILPLLWATRWRRQYQVNLDAEAMPQRWVDLAITSAIMVEIIALLSGYHDIMTLKLVGGLVAITCLLGWLADKQNRKADRVDWSAYAISLVTGVLPWLLIAVTAVTTYIFGIVRSPWYVYALYATTLLGFGAIAWNQRQHYRRANQWKYEVVERNYVLLNLFVKAAFALILIAGLRR